MTKKFEKVNPNPPVNCNNNLEMITENLRVPMLNIDRTIFQGKEGSAAKAEFNSFKKKNPKLYKEVRDRNISAILEGTKLGTTRMKVDTLAITLFKN